MYVPLLPVRFFSMLTTNSKLSQISIFSYALDYEIGEPNPWKYVGNGCAISCTCPVLIPLGRLMPG